MAEATLSGYLVWIRDVMRVPEEALADDSPYIETSFWASETLVNNWLYLVGTRDPTQEQPTIRALCVYNFAGAILCQIAQDDPNAPEPWNHYWSDLRNQFGLNGFTPGVIQSSADQGTSASYKVSSFFDNLTPAELELMKTPWGRFYMSMASWYGPTIWGLT
jgi:hypothetical protein